MNKIKIYKQDGSFYETDNYEIITCNSKDMKEFVQHGDGVKVSYGDDKEFIIPNATIKNFEQKGLSYRNIQLDFNKTHLSY